jgi:hypothetical protein
VGEKSFRSLPTSLKKGRLDGRTGWRKLWREWRLGTLREYIQVALTPTLSRWEREKRGAERKPTLRLYATFTAETSCVSDDLASPNSSAHFAS